MYVCHQELIKDKQVFSLFHLKKLYFYLKVTKKQHLYFLFLITKSRRYQKKKKLKQTISMFFIKSNN